MLILNDPHDLVLDTDLLVDFSTLIDVENLVDDYTGLLAVAAIGFAGMPWSAADPTDDGYDNIFGLITPDEQ